MIRWSRCDGTVNDDDDDDDDDDNDAAAQVDNIQISVGSYPVCRAGCLSHPLLCL